MQFHLLSIGCHVYSYSTVNRRTFDLLHKLQLLPAMDCSGTPHVVDHCSPRWSAVVPLYFHCTLTANISSVAPSEWGALRCVHQREGGNDVLCGCTVVGDFVASCGWRDYDEEERDQLLVFPIWGHRSLFGFLSHLGGFGLDIAVRSKA